MCEECEPCEGYEGDVNRENADGRCKNGLAFNVLCAAVGPLHTLRSFIPHPSSFISHLRQLMSSNQNFRRKQFTFTEPGREDGLTSEAAVLVGVLLPGCGGDGDAPLEELDGAGRCGRRPRGRADWFSDARPPTPQPISAKARSRS